MLTYNQEISGEDKCKVVIGDIKRTSNTEMRAIVRQKIANRVALMYVSIKYCYHDEQGEPIKELFVRKAYRR